MEESREDSPMYIPADMGMQPKQEPKKKATGKEKPAKEPQPIKDEKPASSKSADKAATEADVQEKQLTFMEYLKKFRVENPDLSSAELLKTAKQNYESSACLMSYSKTGSRVNHSKKRRRGHRPKAHRKKMSSRMHYRKARRAAHKARTTKRRLGGTRRSKRSHKSPKSAGSCGPLMSRRRRMHVAKLTRAANVARTKMRKHGRARPTSHSRRRTRRGGVKKSGGGETTMHGLKLNSKPQTFIIKVFTARS